MILILGAGISGLSCAYFLEKLTNEKILIIERKKKIGKIDTGLISDFLIKTFNFYDLIEKEYDAAKFYFGSKFFEVKSNKKMFLIKREQLDKKIAKLISSEIKLNENVEKVELEKNVVKTNKNEYKFDILVDARGAFGDLVKRKKVFGIEFYVKNNDLKKFSGINIFFDRKISREYFAWIVECKNYYKAGFMDIKINNESIQKFKKRFRIKKFFFQYFHPITLGYPKNIAGKNYLIVGEQAVIKPFSLGGITYGFISSFFAAISIKNFLKCNKDLKSYEKIMNLTFNLPIFIGNFFKFFFKHRLINSKIINFFKIQKFFENFDVDFLFYKDKLFKLIEKAIVI